MGLKDITKELKQYILLGVLAAVTLIVLLVMGVRYSLSSIADARTELDELTQKIESADRMLSRRGKTEEDLQRTVVELKEQLRSVPPERNYYSWATEAIYSHARQVGLEVDTINEITQAQNRKTGNDASIQLEAYALRISAQGSYASIKQFVELMHRDYALLRFTGLDVSSGRSPEIHSIQIWLQWPFNLASIAKTWESVEIKQRELGVTEKVVATKSRVTASPQKPNTPQPEASPAVQAKKVGASSPALEPDAGVPAPARNPEPKATPVVRQESVVKTEPVMTQEMAALPESTSEVESPTELSEQEATLKAMEVQGAVPAAKPAVMLQPTPPPPRVTQMQSSADDGAPVFEHADETAEQASIPVEEPTVEADAARISVDDETGTDDLLVNIEPNDEAAQPMDVELVVDEESDDVETQPAATMPETTYVVTAKSARKLEDLLEKNNHRQDDDALNSLINSLMEGAR